MDTNLYDELVNIGVSDADARQLIKDINEGTLFDTDAASIEDDRKDCEAVEKDQCEKCACDYDSGCIAEDINICEQKMIKYTFDKKGAGLTTEILEIGARIKDLSRHYNVYITDLVENLDDNTYSIIFELDDKYNN